MDPFLNGNPKCPEAEQQPERVDVILITHGHGDHYGDTVALAREVRLHGRGARRARRLVCRRRASQNPSDDPNKGGTVDLDGSRSRSHTPSTRRARTTARMQASPAASSSSSRTARRCTSAGDTNVFGDMALIARIYGPDVAVLPIGDHYTMGPREAAVALELLGRPALRPLSLGTFGLLTGTPDALRELAPAGCSRSSRADDPARVSVAAVRERWLGATGRRVPEIVVEGELDVEGALVLDGSTRGAAAQSVRPRAAGRRARRPPDEVRGAPRPSGGRLGARPAGRRDLLELDLPSSRMAHDVLDRSLGPRAALGRRDAVEVPRRRLGRPLGRAEVEPSPPRLANPRYGPKDSSCSATG